MGKQTQIIEHPEFGPLEVVASLRARRCTLRITADAKVRLTLPPGFSLKSGLQFAESKSAWILLHLERIRERRYNALEPITPLFRTRNHVLDLQPVAADVPITCRICDEEKFTVSEADGEVIGLIKITYPATESYAAAAVQQVIRKGIVEAWRREAKQQLPQRIALLATRFGFTFNRVSIRDTRTRWGSCSGRNDISLSLHLMALPDPLIDYILLHELCHTRHKNHGPQFKQLLDRLLDGKLRGCRAELKNFQILQK